MGVGRDKMARGWLDTGQKRKGGVTVLWLWKLRLKEAV